MKDALHNGSTFALLAAVAAVAWIVKGLLSEARDRAGRRIADWLFPLGHPTTYRMARLALAFTRFLAPQTRRLLQLRQRYFRLSDLDLWEEKRLLLPGFKPKLRHERLDWDDLEAAAAELEVDQRQGVPIANPLRFVAPLLSRALKIRMENCSARGALVLSVLVVRPIAIAALLSLLLVGWILRLPWTLGAAVYRQGDLWAASALCRSAAGRMPEKMGEEERDFWIRAMHWDVYARHRRLILSRRFAVDLWIRGRVVLPDRESLPRGNWGRPRWTKQDRTELISAGDEVRFHVLAAARARERRRVHRD